MKYFAVNEEVDKEIKQLKNEIMLSMNGICAENIDNSGLKYQRNFGVSVARLKEIAQNHSKNHELAQRLWFMSIRETKILATLLYPTERFSIDDMNEWIESADSAELIEMLSFGILSKAAHLYDEIIKYMKSDNSLKRLAAYHTIARASNNLGHDTTNQAIASINPSDLDNISAYRAIETFLYNIKLKSKEHDSEVYLLIERLRANPQKYTSILIENIE